MGGMRMWGGGLRANAPIDGPSKIPNHFFPVIQPKNFNNYFLQGTQNSNSDKKILTYPSQTAYKSNGDVGPTLSPARGDPSVRWRRLWSDCSGVSRTASPFVGPESVTDLTAANNNDGCFAIRERISMIIREDPAFDTAEQKTGKPTYSFSRTTAPKRLQHPKPAPTTRSK